MTAPNHKKNNNHDLWKANTPQRFWMIQPNPPAELWENAVRASLPTLQLPANDYHLDHLPALTLGEGQFGPNHWRFGPTLQIYYYFKPILPRFVINLLKQESAEHALDQFPLGWPIEDRYVLFLWEVVRRVLIDSGRSELVYRRFWPEECRFALVLTHDIETGHGQKNVDRVASLEERLGFRSSFNFVPERYPIDHGLMQSLVDRGFEVGVHGLNHDGKDYLSEKLFRHRVKGINTYLKKFNATGFRSPLMHRNPQWMQALEVDYDLSFFDTDPFEPKAGGTMSIWPFQIGHFLELPYTLVQDSTLYHVLGERTPRLWVDKLAFLEQYRGMALVNTHPDYLSDQPLEQIYTSFLTHVKDQGGFWNPLPVQASRWWRRRSDDLPPDDPPDDPDIQLGTICLDGQQIQLQ
jgi:peptidoglycan/xylan/chitin deacetylase (PgdA/CDA1 family)